MAYFQMNSSYFDSCFCQRLTVFVPSYIPAVQWLSSKPTNFGFVKTEVCCLLLAFYVFELELSECKISLSSVSVLNMISVVFVAQ